MNKLLWVCSGSGSPQVEWIYSFLPHYEPDNLSDCREEGATPPTAKGDFFFFFTNNSDCKLATKPTCKQTVDCCFWVQNVCNVVRVCACVVCGGRTIEVIVWIYFQCAEWIFEYSVSKCVIGIVAVISYTANNDKMVQ